MNDLDNSGTAEDIVKFKAELLLLNQKYAILHELDSSNLIEVSRFLKKISFGLGWWVIILSIFSDFFLSLYSLR